MAERKDTYWIAVALRVVPGTNVDGFQTKVWAACEAAFQEVLAGGVEVTIGDLTGPATTSSDAGEMTSTSFRNFLIAKLPEA